MKFRLTFKDPSAFENIECADGALTEIETMRAKQFARQFIRHEETIVIEFDTEYPTPVILRTVDVKV